VQTCALPISPPIAYVAGSSCLSIGVRVHKAPPTFNSAFPIVGTGRMKKKKWISAADEFANQINSLKQNISPGALTRLRNLQPFDLTEDARNKNPVWILSKLNNIYK